MNLYQIVVKLEHSFAEIIQVVQKAFGNNAMSAVQIKVWHKRFKDGQQSVESDPHSTRPTTSRTHGNVECVGAAINKDWRLTVQELGAEPWIPNTTVSDFDTGSWHETCHGKIHSMASATRAEGTLCCSC